MDSLFSRIKITKFSLYLINFIVVIFITTIIIVSADHICWTDNARAFLENNHETVERLSPQNSRVYAILLFASFIVTSLIRNRSKIKNKYLLHALCIIEIILAAFFTRFLSFAYTGIFMLVIANVLTHIKGNIIKIMYVAACILLYILFDKGTANLSSYLVFLGSDIMYIVLNIRNILISLNQIVFLLFVVLLVQEQFDENKKIVQYNGIITKNAACEGVFGRIKNEMFYNRSWAGIGIDEFMAILNDYLNWYNEKRIKMSLGAMSPLEYRNSLGLAI